MDYGYRNKALGECICCYDMITSNIVECINSFFKVVRELPIAIMVEAIHVKLIHFFESRCDLSRTVSTQLTPWVKKYLNNEMNATCHVSCLHIGPMEFQVTSEDFTDVVHLDR